MIRCKHCNEVITNDSTYQCPKNNGVHESIDKHKFVKQPDKIGFHNEIIKYPTCGLCNLPQKSNVHF